MTAELSETVARDRKRLVSLISAALLGPIVGKMPKSSIESLEKFSYYPNIQKHIVDIIPVSEAVIVRHEIAGDFPPFFRTEAVFPKRNLYVLRDAVVSPNSGMVWIENRILEESVGSLRRIMGWGNLLHEPLLPVSALPLAEPVVVCHPASYFHWLLEVLPNLLFAMARFPGIKIVVSEKSPAYIREGLAAILGPRAEERFIVCSSPVMVCTLVMPQYNTHPEFTHPQVFRVLESEVKSSVLGEEDSRATRACGKTIYISRRKSKRRQMTGEELLEGRLRERGVVVLHCEDVSFADQIRIFHEAETVIGIHGAGLSNLVWSKAPCRVIEIFPKNYLLDCFAWLSFSLGFDYRYVICKTGHRIDDHAIAAVLELLES